ncbi:MAG: PilZ domain-containing protein [Candidatus Omnitrophica bacterium]|nr:PilZ domain-containing protein [Candidatus Omnitrophota bacterium]
MTERRKFLRFNSFVDGLVRIIDKSSENVKSSLIDLSREGLRINGKKALEKGENIEIELMIPGDNIPVFAAGQVAWSKRTENKYTSGILFTKLDTMDRTRLLGHVYNEWMNKRS